MTTSLKNQYEELIDSMMIDEVAGLDTNLKLKLQGLDVEDKRIGILSILDQDRGLFKRIVKRLESSEYFSKTEHIKYVVEMLRQYVSVSDVEQRKFGEVMTQISTVNEMLDTLPKEMWSNPNLKWFDTSAGSGVFIACVIERLMINLDISESDEDRYKHIIENMIYFCELQPKNVFINLVSFDSRDEYELNVYCGSFLDKGFDEHMKNVWGLDKFDIIVQNPPYQKEIVGNKRMKTLYNLFIEKSIELSDYLLSIHPSRWMSGGFGLDEFRSKMLKRTDIKLIKHWDNAQEVFGKSIDIRGGVQFFLIDKNYDGLVDYNGLKCSLNTFDVFVENKYSKIINKIEQFSSLVTITKPCSTYGLKNNDKRLLDSEIPDSTKCYVSRQKGFVKYVKNIDINNGKEYINKYKVLTTSASGKGGDGFGNTFIATPNEINTQTYLFFIADSLNEAESLLSYLNTKFANFMLSLRKKTQDIKPDTCKWIPLVPFDREWTDEQLFEYFNISKEEQQLILNS